MAAAAQTVEELDALVSVCRACPRLVKWREQVADRQAASRSPTSRTGAGRYPGWGAARPRVMILGLAPGRARRQPHRAGVHR